ncbi:MAG: cupin domain-containing protein [Burkholderiaceae bacterium]
MIKPVVPQPGPSIDIETAPDPLAGTDAAMRFLQSYWQRRPALLRATTVLGTPGLAEALSPAELIALAAKPDVESRLVRRQGKRYRLEHGPFAAGALPSPDVGRWTLLVQGVDLHSEPAAGLRDRFRFVTDVRLDDIMVSLAANDGGVGPHVDSYDVFLIQVHGRRRWRIAPPGVEAWQKDQPLRVLARFDPTEQWDLDPGDVLYLPPGWAHDGVGLGTCVTASVGFRSPNARELLGSFLQDQVDQMLEEAPAPDDPAGKPLTDRLEAAEFAHWRDHPAALSPGLLRTMLTTLEQWRPAPEAMIDFVGRMLTEPKPSTTFEAPSPKRIATLGEQAAVAGIVLDRRTRMSYAERTVFINGDSFMTDGRTAQLLTVLADHRQLDATEMSELLRDADVSDILIDWLSLGWIHPLQRRQN